MSDVVQMWSTHFGTVELGQRRGAGFRDWGVVVWFFIRFLMPQRMGIPIVFR